MPVATAAAVHHQRALTARAALLALVARAEPQVRGRVGMPAQGYE